MLCVAPGLLCTRPMRWKCVWPLFLLAGCDQGEPPFDELPLRDALRADPAVLASLSDTTRARLAARFEAARTGDLAVDHFSDQPSAARALVIDRMDRARQARQAQPLLLGVLRDDAAWPIDGDDDRSGPPVPTLDGAPATSTADLEARALAGHAGVELRILMAASDARHLERVVGWPSGAVAIDDTIYVNAAWLVALAPAEPRDLDAGVLDGGLPTQSQASRSPAGSTTTAVPFPVVAPPSSVGNVTGAVADTTSPRFYADAGAPPPTHADPPSSTSEPTVADDACATCADGCASSEEDGQGCDSGDTSDEGDYVDSGDDCASSDEGSGDACASESGDVGASEMDSSGCQIAPRAKHPKKKGSQPSAWLLAPLGFIFYRRRP
jgi:hypothetical protein